MLNELQGKKYSLGFIIKYLREKRKMTQQQLFETSEVSTSYISRIESNEKRNVSMKKIHELAKGLGVEVDEIIELVNFEDVLL